MFTLEESALLRRMLLVVLWVVVGLSAAAGLLIAGPWIDRAWTIARTLVTR